MRSRDGRLTSQGRQVPHPRRKGLRWAKGSCLQSQGCARFTLNPILNIGLEGQGNSSELQGISEDLGTMFQGGTLKKDCPAYQGTLTVRELSLGGVSHIIINSIGYHHHPSCNRRTLGGLTKKGVIKKYIKVFKRDSKLAWVALQPGTPSKTYDSIVATTIYGSLCWLHAIDLDLECCPLFLLTPDARCF